MTKVWRFVKDGDQEKEFDRLFSAFHRGGGHFVGALPDRHMTSGLTVVIFDGPNEELAKHLLDNGWEESPVGSK